MADPTTYEQLLLELVNRARMDPLGEAARLGIGLNDGLAAGTITATPKQALAGNVDLVTAARGHSQFMIDTDQFNHQGIGDGTPTSRMQDAGYVLAGSWMTGENIAWSGTTGAVNELAYVAQLHDNLFRSAGHRHNLMTDEFLELGTGISTGVFTSSGIDYNAVMATENFGLSGAKVFVTGVAIADADGDNFYDPGEQRFGIDVSVTTAGIADGSATTASAGGYALGVAAGTHAVTFSGGDLTSAVNVTAYAAAGNAKIDLSGTNKILSSVTVALGDGAKDAVLLGAFSTAIYGNTLSNVLTGNKANNVLIGAAGNDVLIGAAGNDSLRGDAGRDTLTGGIGADQFVYLSLADSGLAATTRDVIRDFTHSATLALSDRINVSAIDASTAAAGNQAFGWLGSSAFTGRAGQLHYRWENPTGTINDKTIVEGDINGDRRADFQIELTGLKALLAADFIL